MISIVMTAGKSSRMNSSIHKTLHKVGNKKIIRRIYEKLEKIPDNKIIFVLGHNKEQIIEEFQDIIGTNKLEYVVQEEQLGTAHAVKTCYDIIKYSNDDVLIINGDLPLITEETLINMQKKLKDENLDLIIMSSIISDPTGYGRIIKNENSNVLRIVEEKDANNEEKNIKEINGGVYLFKKDSLIDFLDNMNNNNKQKEYYLTTAIEYLLTKNKKISSYISSSNEILGVNTKQELYNINKLYNKLINEKHIENGVIIYDIDSTIIDETVEIGENTIIYPNVIIKNYTKIGNNCIIYSGSVIENSKLCNNIVVKSSYILDSIIENNVTIGPFANIRPESTLLENSHIGNFVEIKKSRIGFNTKIGHLTYIGDSEIGNDTNIGAGTITCNYDGYKKHKSKIGNNSFIGSNTIIVSPVNIGDYTLTAAGSVITKDIENFSLAFGRSKQVNKSNYLKKQNEGE